MVGNIQNFTKIDVLRCFLKFNKNISRHELAKELELGEGTIRTILNVLKSKKLLVSNKKGHSLSESGVDLLKHAYKSISMPKFIILQNIYPQLKKVGVLVRDASKLREIYKLRDIAVKNRADGAIILKFENKLYAPESNYEQDYKELEKYFDFKNDDVLVIAFSNENKNAENGALAIAIELNQFLKNFMSGF